MNYFQVFQRMEQRLMSKKYDKVRFLFNIKNVQNWEGQIPAVRSNYAGTRQSLPRMSWKNYCLSVRLDYIIGKIRVTPSLHSPLISAFEFHVKYFKQFTLLIGLQVKRNFAFVQKNKICLQPLEHDYLRVMPHHDFSVLFLAIYGINRYISSWCGHWTILDMAIGNLYPERAFGIQYMDFHSNSFLDIIERTYTFLHDYLAFYFEKFRRSKVAKQYRVPICPSLRFPKVDVTVFI